MFCAYKYVAYINLLNIYNMYEYIYIYMYIYIYIHTHMNYRNICIYTYVYIIWGDRLGSGHIRILYEAPEDDTKPQQTLYTGNVKI